MSAVFLERWKIWKTWEKWVIWKPHWEIIAMKQFTTGDLNKQIGDITDAASREPVMLTRHKKPRFVLMSYEHYERMRTGGNPRRAYHISEMPAEHAEVFDEALDRLAGGEGYDDEP